MNKLTLNFNYLDNGNVKATVYEDTNRYLMEVISTDVAGCISLVLDRMKEFSMYVNDSLTRRAN